MQLQSLHTYKLSHNYYNMNLHNDKHYIIIINTAHQMVKYQRSNGKNQPNDKNINYQILFLKQMAYHSVQLLVIRHFYQAKQLSWI